MKPLLKRSAIVLSVVFIALWLFLLGAVVHADTPPQVINKTCPTHQWFEAIVKGQPPVCTQPTYADIAGSAPAGVWGTITGTLSNQADLQAALNTKTPTTRLISTTAPITGGGDLSGDRTIACNVASGSQAGCLSSADWTTFNNKAASGNYITALTGDVTASGPGSASATLAATSVVAGSYTNTNLTVDAKGRITAAANGSSSGGGVTSVGATSPVHSSGGSTPTISIDTASGSQPGALSSTDWTTFNSKQAALGFTPVNKAGDTMTGFLTVGGAFATPILVTSTNLTLNATHYTIVMNSSGGVKSVTLPSASANTGRIYVIKAPNAGTNNVTVVGTLDGATNYVLNINNESITVQSNGTDWSIL